MTLLTGGLQCYSSDFYGLGFPSAFLTSLRKRRASGLVFRAADKEGNEVAIKKVPLARESKSAVENEISLMKMLDCEYFVRLLEDAYMEDEDEMWVSSSHKTITKGNAGLSWRE